MKGNGILGIRKEDKNKWERRVAVTPDEVGVLVKEYGIKVLVEPAPNRAFTDDEFEDAGAIITEDLSPACLIIGVKEVPIDKLIPDKTYMFFSHTIKAQEYNMPLLDSLLKKNIRLIDYECIKEKGEKGDRLVAFGRFAGLAGCVDFFRGMGEFLLHKGLNTPLLHLGSAYMYPDLVAIKDAMKKIGDMIKKKGLPKKISPLVVAFTSNGRVSQGAMELFEYLPHKYIKPEELKDIVEKEGAENDNKIIYAVIIDKEHMVKKIDSNEAFDNNEYKEFPEKYEPYFHEAFLPYISIIFNCMYWEMKYARLVTDQQMENLVRANRSRLLGVCDISCDFQGSIEFLKKFTSIEHPFYVYNALNHEIIDAIGNVPENANNECILFHAVDHLPAELPKEASEHFGLKLMPFLKDLVFSDGTLPYEKQTDYAEELKLACITCHGKLNPNYEYIAKLRALHDKMENLTLKLGEKDKDLVEEEEKISENKLGKGLKRVHSYITIELTGHLFDRGVFKQMLDVLEEMQMQFRIIDWVLGQRKEDPTKVVIQIFAKNKNTFQECLGTLIDLAEENDVKFNEAYNAPSIRDDLQTPDKTI